MRWDEIDMEDSQLARNMISREWTSTTAAQPYELFTRVQPGFIQIPIVSVVLRGWKPHRLLIFGHDKAGRDKAKGLALAKIEERVRTLGHWVWMCSPLSLLAHKKLSTNDSQGLHNDPMAAHVMGAKRMFLDDPKYSVPHSDSICLTFEDPQWSTTCHCQDSRRRHFRSRNYHALLQWICLNKC